MGCGDKGVAELTRRDPLNPGLCASARMRKRKYDACQRHTSVVRAKGTQVWCVPMARKAGAQTKHPGANRERRPTVCHHRGGVVVIKVLLN